MSGGPAERDLSMDLLIGAARSRSGNRMIREATSASDLDREYLTLKVVRHSQDLEIHFRVKRTTMMFKLKRSYSERVGVSSTNLRFLYEGRRIMDDDTPGNLEMESGDYIEVFMGLGLSHHDVELREEPVTEELPTVTNLVRAKDRITRRASYSRHDSPSPRTTEGDHPQLAEEEAGDGRRRNKKRRLMAYDPDTDIDSDNEREDGLEAVRKNLAKVTKKYDDLVRKLRDKVECPVCFDVPKAAPIPVCPNGHVVCVKCVREVCPTCREKMEKGTSTLAVAVIENIEHTCEHEDCGKSFPHSEISAHIARCNMRPVNCPGLDCGVRLPRLELLTHMTGCCVTRGEIKACSLPQRFTYMMNEDVTNLEDEQQNFNWKLEAVKFDNRVFFLKVTRKARSRRWYFYVQMVGYQEQAQGYSMEMTLCRPDEGESALKYSQKMSGDVCPLEVTTVDSADEKGFCLTLRDGAMAKYFLRNKDTGENQFSVNLNVCKV